MAKYNFKCNDCDEDFIVYKIKDDIQCPKGCKNIKRIYSFALENNTNKSSIGDLTQEYIKENELILRNLKMEQ